MMDVHVFAVGQCQTPAALWDIRFLKSYIYYIFLSEMPLI